jgi:hypothetical protein
MPKIPINEVLVLLFELQHHSEAQQRKVADAGLDAQLALLRKWQSERLRRTYADLLAQEKYRPACEFFLSDIYAARDFSQRDHDAERLYEIFSRHLPVSALYLLAGAIRMNQLTNRLDHDLLQVLVNELGVAETITLQDYVEGYRRCNNFAERTEQIDLVVQNLREVGKVARNPLMGVAVRLARGPAQRAGWIEVYDFLERGYAALRNMRDLGNFVATIEQREKRILERIYAGHPHPFER